MSASLTMVLPDGSEVRAEDPVHDGWYSRDTDATWWLDLLAGRMPSA